MEEKKYCESFYQNKGCKYYPCHNDIAEEEFSCLFCYCPLYALGDSCGGNFSYDNEKGIKDCSGCTLPHRKNSYEYICRKCGEICDMVRKQK